MQLNQSNHISAVPILMYHSVEDCVHEEKYKHLYVTAKEFRSQMLDLKRRGYNAVTFDQLNLWRTEHIELPINPVLLTFDDAYANLERNVHPIMLELGLPYTAFVVSSLVGNRSNWVMDEGLEPWPLMDWPTISRLAKDSVVSFQPHTVSHAHLTRLNRDDALHEILDSRSELEDRLQKPMNTFCYPFGDFDEGLEQLVLDSGFVQAVTTRFGRARQSDKPASLPRISIYHVPFLSLNYGIGPLNFRWRIETRKDSRPLEGTAE